VICSDPAATGLGAYVLGALEPQEQRRVEEHVDACAACATELAELRPLPALLGRVRPEDLQPMAVEPSPDLFARMSAAAAAETGRPRRWRSRTMALVAAVVLAVLGVGAGVTVWVAQSGPQTVSTSVDGVEVTLTASRQDGGTALDVVVAGLRPGEICRLVAVDQDGNRHPGGDWPASDAGDGRWVGWADVERAALVGVAVLGEGGRELAYLAL
jgi:anti-sigma-K factor RskA